MNLADKILGIKLPQAVWDVASAIYAAGARGTAPVFTTVSKYAVDVSKTFFRVEVPIIEALGKVELIFR